MPVTATGSETGISVDRADVQISVPVDGDPRNASSVNTPLQKLADYLQRVRKKGVFTDLANTIGALLTLTHRLVVSRQGGDTEPALDVTSGGVRVVGGIATDTLTASGAVSVGSLASSGAVSATTSLSGSTLALTAGATIGGTVDLSSATAPTSSDAFANVLTKANIPRAWGAVEVSGGAATLADGFNVTSVVVSGNSVVVTLAGDMASANYVVVAQQLGASASTSNLGALVHSRTVGAFSLKAFDAAGVVLNPASATFTVMFTVHGRQ